MGEDRYWQALRSIPVGETRSFAEIAAIAGRPGGARAAGRCLGAIPAGSRLPWHRAVRANRSLAAEPERAAAQRRRLEREGAIPRRRETVVEWVRRTGAPVVGRRPEKRFAAAQDDCVAAWPADRVVRFGSAVTARQAGFVPLDAGSDSGPVSRRRRRPLGSRPAATIGARLARIEWTRIRSDLLRRGVIRIPRLLAAAECDRLIDRWNDPDRFERSIVMAPRHYGVGEYRYWREPAPAPIGSLRTALYARLLPVAEEIRAAAATAGTVYPPTLTRFWRRCRVAGQRRAASILLRYGAGGINHPHRDIYGREWFPVQALVVLSRIGIDYSGGRFVLLEESRGRSGRHREVRADRGDLVLFLSQWRWEQTGGRRRKVNLRHAMTPIHRGERFALGIVFHLAK